MSMNIESRICYRLSLKSRVLFFNEIQIKRKCNSQKRKKKASIKIEHEIVLLLTLTKLMKNMVLKSE